MTQTQNKIAFSVFVCAIGITIFVHLSSWLLAPVVLTYLQAFSTYWHEIGHAIAAKLIGYEVHSISIYKHLGGETRYYAFDTKPWKRFLVAMGGPMGTTIIAFILIVWTSFLKKYCWWNALLFITMIIISLPFLDTGYGLLVIGGYVVILFFAIAISPWQVTYLVLLFIGFNLVIDELFYGGIAYLFMGEFSRFGEIMRSDTRVMGNVTGLPYWFWGALLAFIQCFLAAISMKAALAVLKMDGIKDAKKYDTSIETMGTNKI